MLYINIRHHSQYWQQTYSMFTLTKIPFPAGLGGIQSVGLRDVSGPHWQDVCFKYCLGNTSYLSSSHQGQHIHHSWC